MSNDGVCSFRAANRLSALTSRSIAYRTITIISAISRLKFHPSGSSDGQVNSSRDTRQLHRAPACFSFVLELISPPRLVALPNEPFVSAAPERMASRQGFLEESHECQQCDREDAQGKRRLRQRIDTDCDQTAARKNFFNKGKFSCVPVGHTPLHLRSTGRDTNGNTAWKVPQNN